MISPKLGTITEKNAHGHIKFIWEDQVLRNPTLIRYHPSSRRSSRRPSWTVRRVSTNQQSKKSLHINTVYAEISDILTKSVSSDENEPSSQTTRITSLARTGQVSCLDGKASTIHPPTVLSGGTMEQASRGGTGGASNTSECVTLLMTDGSSPRSVGTVVFVPWSFKLAQGDRFRHHSLELDEADHDATKMWNTATRSRAHCRCDSWTMISGTRSCFKITQWRVSPLEQPQSKGRTWHTRHVQVRSGSANNLHSQNFPHPQYFSFSLYKTVTHDWHSC